MKNIHLLLLINVCIIAAFNQFYKTKHQLQFCVSQVISQIFDESSTVVNVFSDQNMISNINELSHIAVNVSNEIKGVYDKYASNYILQAETINMIKFSLDNIILNGHLSNWPQSKRGRFIIITEEQDISAIFNWMWGFFIIDLVVLKYDDVIQNFLMHTSSPFLRENDCGLEANKIQRQICSSDAVIIFPEIIKNYNKCFYIYGVYDAKDINQVTPLFSSLKLTLEAIETILNITIHVVEINPGEHDHIKFGIRHYFGSGLFDLTLDDMTTIFFYDDFLWFGTKAEKHLNTFFTPFSIKTWILIVIVFVLILIIWWLSLILHKLNAHKLETFFESFSQITSLLFGVALPVIPKPICIKFIILPYLLYTIHIQTAYTSDMINNLVIPQYEHNINNIDDLAKSDFPIFIQNEKFDAYFTEDVDNFETYTRIKRKLIAIQNIDETKNYTFKKFFFFSENYLHSLRTNSNNRKITNTFVSNDVSGSFRMAFFMQRGNYLLPSLNRVITFLHEFGFYLKAYEYGDYFINTSVTTQVVDYIFDISEIEIWSNSLRTNDFMGVFIVFGSGCLKVEIPHTDTMGLMNKNTAFALSTKQKHRSKS
ncbi:hypothetical protein FQR65_LT08642 [Abscondita terminalis]|nr:hypothetical protein FQR65_LT08642 [Abscondita terminalis]